MISSNWILWTILGTAMILSVITRKLTLAAALTGGVVGLLVFIGAGYTGIVMTGVFFILGSAATSWKMHFKIRSGLAEINKGRRTSSQVIANAGVAGILGLLSWFFPANTGVFQLMMAASISSALSDTLSSEMGNVYGKRFYNIVSFKSDTRGSNGVISIEGTLFGLAGSLIIAVIYALGFGWSPQVLTIIVAGIAGNISDSILGATLERQGIVNNDQVNFLNTLLSALVALTLN